MEEPRDLASLGLSHRLPTLVLGATGTVGQRFISLLHAHPWFEVTAIAASERNVGKTYAEAVRWIQPHPIPSGVANMKLGACDPATVQQPMVVFSALDPSVAGEIETAFANASHLVVSNASSHRMDADVPLLVPEVNADHIELLRHQSTAPVGGGIVANPNCSTIGLVLALAPLERTFGIRRVSVVSMQAVSGAGLPGVSSYEILDNVIPFIPREEDKLEAEGNKILGTRIGGTIETTSMQLSAACNRVPVVDGHTLCVSVELGAAAELEEIADAWRSFEGVPQERRLPSAPRPVLQVLADPAAPQPRLHRDAGGGMAVSIGRLRPCSILGYKFVALSHNTVRGAAGGAILGAELALDAGFRPGLPSSPSP